ncbi:hypothetical protein ACTXT7_000847 [Hymenolepis weldensis]
MRSEQGNFECYRIQNEKDQDSGMGRTTDDSVRTEESSEQAKLRTGVRAANVLVCEVMGCVFIGAHLFPSEKWYLLKKQRT